MTAAQWSLIDRTLYFLGIAGIAGCALAISVALVRMWYFGMSWGRFFAGMFNPSDGGAVLYPLAALGVLSLWVRAFLRSGRS